MRATRSLRGELLEAVGLAFAGIRRHKLRSALTVLGIVIGVSAVIGISSVILGLNRNVMMVIDDLGSNIIFVYRFNWATLGRPSSEALTRPELTYEDGMAVGELPRVVAVAPGLRLFNPQFGEGAGVVRSRTEEAKNVILEGDPPLAQRVFNIPIAEGRWINEVDEQHRRMVVVLGYDTADTLFPLGSWVGREVRIEGQLFSVIGVMERRKQAFGAGKNPEDNIAILPLSTFRKLHPEYKDYLLSVKVDSPESLPVVIDGIRDLLRRRRRLPPNKPDNFAIFTQDAFTELWKQISGGFFILMFAVSSVGLLVGGVGVMNIMLVSVTERTREIGIRKAVGARRRHILWQFVVEAMTLTGVGGVLGILLGAGISVVVNRLPIGLPATLSAFWVSCGFVVSVSVGLVFGIYPAWKAAQLDPVVALRYE
ncbi:MAG: ABC transporter permease [Terriglobia bacterium]